MLSPAILLLLGLTIFPSIYSLVLSFGDWPTTRRNAAWTFEGLGNYQRVFTDPRALNAFKVTAVYVVGAVGAETLLGLLIALLLNGQRRGVGITRTIIMLPMMTTPVVVGLIWRLMFNTDVGWINFFFRLIDLPALDWLGFGVHRPVVCDYRRSLGVDTFCGIDQPGGPKSDASGSGGSSGSRWRITLANLAFHHPALPTTDDRRVRAIANN